MHKYSVLTRSIGGYAAFIALWFLSRFLISDRAWPLALINTVAEYLFIPLPVLLLLSLVKHQKSSLFLIIPILAFVSLFGKLFWPFPNKTLDLQTGPIVTAMSFNILHTNTDYQAIVDSIYTAAPDVIGFQELKPSNAEPITQMLASEYPYGTLQNLERGQDVGLLSRFPLEKSETFLLPSGRIAIHVTILIDGIRIHFFVVHLSPNNFFQVPVAEMIPRVIERYGQRMSEVNHLEEEVTTLTEPVVLLCDCNLTDTSEAYAHLTSFLDDSFVEVGWGMRHTLQPPQFPFPIQRIDYVWHSNDFVAIEALIGQSGESDHLPVVAKLEFVGKP